MNSAIPISRRDTTRLFGSIAALLTTTAIVPGAALAASTLRYRDASLPVETRVADLIGRMTLDEKIMQLQCVREDRVKIQDKDGNFVAALAQKVFPDGLGMVAHPSERKGFPDTDDFTTRTSEDAATYINAVQKWAIENTRLGIPLLMHEEALHGFMGRDGTCFPQAIGLASSFDPDMLTEIFSVAASEMRARGANIALAPVVDIALDPRWGRIEETFGEDPHVCAEMGKAAVLGLSGNTLPLPKDKVYATLKHMTGHGQPANGTNIGPASLGERTLRETFLPPFERIISETKIAAIMPSYNEVDGKPSHANRWMLNDLLRDEWKFEGLTVSDYSGISDLVDRHKLAPDLKQAALISLKAGVDMELPDPRAYIHLGALVREGKIAETEIDSVVRRILRLKFLLGLFENPYVDAKKADAATGSKASGALARRCATRTPVLLKNSDNLLPLDPAKTGKMLVLGTHARDTPIGGYSDIPRYVISVLQGLQREGKAQGFAVDYSEGVRITEQRIWAKDEVRFTDPAVNRKLIADAVEAAKSADTIVMVLGDNEMTSREAWSDTHMGDRQTLDLMGMQNDLAEAIFALGKPTIVWLLNGRPMTINLLAEKADALVEGWYMGQETGTATADLLFGRANFGGKLPVSIPRSVGQLPVYYHYKPTARRGYLDGTTKPLFPFGFGLSYTSFTVSQPALDRASIGPDESVGVAVTVTNTGAVAGDEVVQVYVRDDIGSVTTPVRLLKRFKRVALKPGETKTVRFNITPADLALRNAAMKRVVEPGTFTISAGPNSVDLKSVTLTVI
jgi:beta-glucosidase